MLLALLLAQSYNLNQGVTPSYNRADPSIGVFGNLKVNEETPLAGYTFQYGINTDLVSTSTADGGTVTQSANMAVVATGTADSGVAILTSKAATRYVPGQGIRLRFTAVWTTCTANSRQEVGIGNANDGYFFGCVGSSFGIIHRNNGSETFIAQSAWNGKRPTFNVTKGNVYSIAYQWLGFGVIRFQMELPSGEMVLVHQIEYPDTATTTSVQNPIMKLWVRALNYGNTSDVIVRVPSFGIVTEGHEATYGVANGIASRKAITTAYRNVVTLQNKSTFLDAGNLNRLRVTSIHLSATGDLDVTCQLVSNATLGGTPVYTDTAASSFSAIDVAGTTVTGGRIRYGMVFEAGPGGGAQIVLPGHGIYVEPGETLTVECTATTGAPTVGVGLNWHEEF
jgi:hypothetical protein